MVCFNPRGIRRSKAVWGGQNRQGWEEEEGPGGGGLFGNWGEGTALPLLGSPQPLRPGREGAACNPQGQVWGCQMRRAGGWGAHKGLPSREMTALPPSFSARVQRSLTSS